MEEALRELRAAPDGEGVQLRARVGEEARAVIGDAAAPRDVELVRVRVRIRVRGVDGFGSLSRQRDSWSRQI